MGVGGGRGPMSRVQPYGRRNHPARPPARKPAPFTSTGCCCCPARRRERRGGDGSSAPSAGPLAGLWRGERDEAGRGPLKHKPTALFMSALNSKKENAQSQAGRQRVCVCVGGGVGNQGGVQGRRPRARRAVHPCKRMKSSWLPPDHGGRTRRRPARLPLHVVNCRSVQTSE